MNYGRKGTVILFSCCVLFLAGCGSKSVQQQIVDEKEYDMTDQEIRKYLDSVIDGLIALEVVQEDFSHAEEDGMVGVDFCINGKQYHYDAKYQYDWFDEGILLYIGSILMQEENEQCLYGCSDGCQNLILFYETQEWIEQFADVTGICPEKFFLVNDERGESF